MFIKIFGLQRLEKYILLLRCKPHNIKDKSVVAIMKETDIVGHVPYNISSLLSNFLKRDSNNVNIHVRKAPPTACYSG